MPANGERRGGDRNRVEGNDFRGPTQIQQGGTGNRQTYVAGLSYRAVAGIVFMVVIGLGVGVYYGVRALGGTSGDAATNVVRGGGGLNLGTGGTDAASSEASAAAPKASRVPQSQATTGQPNNPQVGRSTAAGRPAAPVNSAPVRSATSHPAVVPATPSPTKTSRTLPSGASNGSVIGFQPVSNTLYCLDYQQNPPGTDFWVGLDNNEGNPCEEAEYGGDWQYNVNTGLIQIDYGGHCLDAGSAGSTPTVTSSCNQNSAGQRWAFYRVAGDYVIESDTALCINTVPDNGSITMQPCTGDSGSELFNIDNSP